MSIAQKALMYLRTSRFLFVTGRDPVWLCSYPRSGNTWMRFVLSEILYGEQDIRHTIPDIHAGRGVYERRSYTFAKSHYPWNKMHRRCVYLIRSPYDVIPSYWKWSTNPQRRRPLKIDFPTFVEKELSGRNPYGRWDRHVASYRDAARTREGVLFMKYEDVVLDPLQAVETILGMTGTAHRTEHATVVVDKYINRMLEPKMHSLSYEDRCRRVYDRQVGRSSSDLDSAIIDRICRSEVGAYAHELGYRRPGT